MPAVLTEKDRDLILVMRRLKIIEKVQPDLLGPKEGAVIVMCGDGDHCNDKFSHFTNLLEQCGSKVRPHLLADNGGAIWIPKSDILKKVPFPLMDEILIWKIAESLKLKDMQHVFLCAHAPCGMAREIFNLSVYDVVKLIFEGKERLKIDLKKYGIDQVEVRCFLHIYDENDSRCRETRFLNRKQWEVNKFLLSQYDDTETIKTTGA